MPRKEKTRAGTKVGERAAMKKRSPEAVACIVQPTIGGAARWTLDRTLVRGRLPVTRPIAERSGRERERETHI